MLKSFILLYYYWFESVDRSLLSAPMSVAVCISNLDDVDQVMSHANELSGFVSSLLLVQNFIEDPIKKKRVVCSGLCLKLYDFLLDSHFFHFKIHSGGMHPSLMIAKVGRYCDTAICLKVHVILS